ncbi:MAG: hypothetical protein HKM93_00005, partial [Desulfobacteraceae bacterium]|nr:hypothetical protein [Desulfobacteraceae bacterium]
TRRAFMDLASLLKSRFKQTKIQKISSNPDIIEVVFPEKGCLVTVTEDLKTGRYSASYPELVKDDRGGWKTEDGFSQNMLIDGVFWILKQVKRYGKVRPEMVPSDRM